MTTSSDSALLGIHPQPDGAVSCCIAFCGKPARVSATFGEYGTANLCKRHYQEAREHGLSGHAMTDSHEIEGNS